MKITKFTLFALFAALVMVGCEPDIIGGNGGNEGTTEVSNKGLLSIAQLTVECRTDEKEPDTGINPKGVATRSSVDVNSFDCSIIMRSASAKAAGNSGHTTASTASPICFTVL